MFINLQTEKAYCLPDGYEINDPSLEDIRHVLNPRCFSIASNITFQQHLKIFGMVLAEKVVNWRTVVAGLQKSRF